MLMCALLLATPCWVTWSLWTKDTSQKTWADLVWMIFQHALGGFLGVAPFAILLSLYDHITQNKDVIGHKSKNPGWLGEWLCKIMDPADNAGDPGSNCMRNLTTQYIEGTHSLIEVLCVWFVVVLLWMLCT